MFDKRVALLLCASNILHGMDNDLVGSKGGKLMAPMSFLSRTAQTVSPFAIQVGCSALPFLVLAVAGGGMSNGTDFNTTTNNSLIGGDHPGGNDTDRFGNMGLYAGVGVGALFFFTYCSLAVMFCKRACKSVTEGTPLCESENDIESSD
jgi:hypothetical protein